MKIYAPVKDFNGLRNNVRFVNGVGETNDSRLSEWFRNHGYKVTIDDSNLVISNVLDQIEIKNDEVETNKLDDEEPNFDDMTPNELRDYMKANGLGNKIGNIRNKEKLLAILKG